MSKRTAAHQNRAHKAPASLKSAENSDLLKVYMTELSWQIAGAILGFSLGGFWLDRQFGTKPLLTLIGLVLGSASAAMIVKRFIDRNYPNNQKDES